MKAKFKKGDLCYDPAKHVDNVLIYDGYYYLQLFGWYHKFKAQSGVRFYNRVTRLTLISRGEFETVLKRRK